MMFGLSQQTIAFAKSLAPALIKAIGMIALAEAWKASTRSFEEKRFDEQSEDILKLRVEKSAIKKEHDEMVTKYADLAKKYGEIVQAQEALTKIPSKEESPSYEWVDFDDYDEDEHELKYNSANGALYNGNMIANGTMRELADLLYMEVMGLDYPTTARVNAYPRGSTHETEPEEIRITIYFDAGDTYGLEDE
jgi:hypothetical protein|nr:MAG TPA: hypothetical protein [Caudoviricetes sp.]